jgi:hypothetical protein
LLSDESARLVIFQVTMADDSQAEHLASRFLRTEKQNQNWGTEKREAPEW